MHAARLKKLLRDINDDDASIRRSAAEALAEGDDRALYPLIKALRDNNLGVQDAAMRSLMSIRGESTVYMVLPLLRENSYLRNTALIILKEMGNIAVPLLYLLLNDRDDDVRKFALDLIHDIQYCTYPEKLVEMLTGDPNANVRAAAAKTIGRLEYKKAVPQLVKALKDEEWVCFSALEAITHIGDNNSFDAIMELLLSPSETIRFAAIEALGAIGTSEAVQCLADHIPRTDGFERSSTIKSLVRTGNVPSLPGVSDTLVEMLHEDDWDDKLIAIKGLAALKYEKAVYPIVDLAGSLDLSVPENEDKFYMIKEAIIAIGCNKSLIGLVNDSSLKFRGKVFSIEVLGEMQCRDAVPDLIKVLNSDFRDIRRSSIKSLGQIGGDEANKCLIEAIDDEDSHVRKSAISTLGKIGDMSAFDPLMKMINKEPYDDVIDEFINALMLINVQLFLSRSGELNEKLREIVERRTADMNQGVTC